MTDPAAPDQRAMQKWRLFESSQRYDRALEAAREWLAADPTSASAHFAVGHDLQALGRAAEAEPHLRQALALDPHNHMFMRGLALALVKLKRHEEAISMVRKAVEAGPEEGENWTILALVCFSCGDMDGTRQFSAKALALDPDSSEAANLLALSQQGASQAQALEVGLSIDPSNPDLHHNLGIYHFLHSGNARKAEECFRTALMLRPDFENSRVLLRRILARRDPVIFILRLPEILLAATRKPFKQYPVLWFLFSWVVYPLSCLFLPWLVLVLPVAWLYERFVWREPLPEGRLAGPRPWIRKLSHCLLGLAIAATMLRAYWLLIECAFAHPNTLLGPLLGLGMAFLAVVLLRSKFREYRKGRTRRKVRKEAAALRAKAGPTRPPPRPRRPRP